MAFVTDRNRSGTVSELLQIKNVLFIYSCFVHPFCLYSILYSYKKGLQRLQRLQAGKRKRIDIKPSVTLRLQTVTPRVSPATTGGRPL